jgi:hypothetical protein
MSRRRRERTRGTPPSPSPAAPQRREDERLVLTRWTGIFGASGAATVVLGFVLLAQGSMSLAPALLALGFLVLFPLALVR